MAKRSRGLGRLAASIHTCSSGSPTSAATLSSHAAPGEQTLSNPTTRTVSSPSCTTCVWDRPSRSSPAGNPLPSRAEGRVRGLAAGDGEPLARDGDGDAVEAGESTGAVADVEPGGPDASGVATAAGLVLEVP